MIKVNVKTSQISLMPNHKVDGKSIEKTMLKVICKEDTSINDIRYIYLKKSKTGIGRFEQQIRSGIRKSDDSNANGSINVKDSKTTGGQQGKEIYGALNRSPESGPGNTTINPE